MSTTAAARAIVAGRKKIPMLSIASRLTSPKTATTNAAATGQTRGPLLPAHPLG
jgi:hypothetical protein